MAKSKAAKNGAKTTTDRPMEEIGKALQESREADGGRAVAQAQLEERMRKCGLALSAVLEEHGFDIFAYIGDPAWVGNRSTMQAQAAWTLMPRNS